MEENDKNLCIKACGTYKGKQLIWRNYATGLKNELSGQDRK
jgi:hypothetical protein